MDPTSCNDQLSDEERRTLLTVADSAIRERSAGGRYRVDPSDHAEALQHHRACFVTLYKDDALRGCVGCLEPRDPLVVEVARSAENAAFSDPRFPAVQAEEIDTLSIHISALSVPTPMSFEDRADLLAQLRPHVDGIALRDGDRSATFLPVVWQKFPQPANFLSQLMLKAGLPADHWSEAVQVERYTTEAF